MRFQTFLPIFIIATLLIFTACGAVEEETEGVDFGAQYTIVVSDDLPAVSDGDVIIEVSYTACEAGHEFNLNTDEVADNDFRVWLTKITPNDECTDLQTQVEQHSLPEAALNGRITVSGPNVDLVVQEG
ncbi:MAG: hypothetical protein JJU46_02985 [Balneolaceae bacterium]|nr:hypothetical protein [Balneolaceae bacterium]MCH8550106.1 hypothetical protein [Balneolaceae bacterium]